MEYWEKRNSVRGWMDVYTCNGHCLRFQREAAEYGEESLEARGAWRGERGDGRFALGSRIMAAGLTASGRWKKIANCGRCNYNWMVG